MDFPFEKWVIVLCTTIHFTLVYALFASGEEPALVDVADWCLKDVKVVVDRCECESPGRSGKLSIVARNKVHLRLCIEDHTCSPTICTATMEF